MNAKQKRILFTILVKMLFFSCFISAQQIHFKEKNPHYSRTATDVLHISDEQWKKILSPELYYVARQGGTETAFTGAYYDSNEKGTYYCAVCGNALFYSTSKFATTCGWPSFFKPVRKNSVIYKIDRSYGMERTEVLCARCNSHLGHRFEDGPPPTGYRYCMNSICLDFAPTSKR